MSASLAFPCLTCVLIGVLLAFFIGHTNASLGKEATTFTIMPYYINDTVRSKMENEHHSKSLGKTQPDVTAYKTRNRYKRGIYQRPSLINFQERNILMDALRRRREYDLFIIGTYIAAQKYFGNTFINTHEKVPFLFTRFPQPPYGMHKDINEACNQSIEMCVYEVLSKARISGTMGPILNNNSSKDLKDPFKTLSDMALYRISAMYYFCLHALRGANALEFKNQDRKCLSDLKITLDAKHISSSNIPFDARETEVSYEQQPLTCAFLWFCPDPCYGRDTKGSFPMEYFQDPGKDTGNPCRNLKDPSCAWKEDDNTNLEGLRKNLFNITCKCSNDYPGSFFNNQNKKCTFQNGCLVDDRSCGTTIKNTKKQFMSNSKNQLASESNTEWTDLKISDVDVNYDFIDFEIFGSASLQRSQFCQIVFVLILTFINTNLFA
ncbi:hypothetical protein ACJMK2_043435 [Sinanodonta woodiana]|uniref:Uncharacterized protein n=1 Tax=Sinanodonta woodiana TaxID=1069815 RepID=A0ABD3VWW6_SINWO